MNQACPVACTKIPGLNDKCNFDFTLVLLWSSYISVINWLWLSHSDQLRMHHFVCKVICLFIYVCLFTFVYNESHLLMNLLPTSIVGTFHDFSHTALVLTIMNNSIMSKFVISLLSKVKSVYLTQIVVDLPCELPHYESWSFIHMFYFLSCYHAGTFILI